MTYISGFHCDHGIVLCADSQETSGDQKRDDVEKLFVSDNYPLAVGGAGLGEAIDAFAQELIASVEKNLPTTIPALQSIIEAALKENHEKDAASSEWPAEYRKVQYLIAARPNHDKFVLFRIKGKRIYVVKKHAIIGYATDPNVALLKRMYRPDLPMQQAVMLAIYLVSQSKALDLGVGGEPRVAIVNDDVAWLDYADYLANSEKRVADFVKLMDTLFLLCIDISIAPSRFQDVLKAFSADVAQLRDTYLRQSAAIALNHAFHDPDYKGEAYPRVFLGATTTVVKNPDGTTSVRVTEETQEEKTKRQQMLEIANTKLDRNREANQQFAKLMEGRTPIYLGHEVIELRPSRSAEVASQTNVCSSTGRDTRGQQS